MYKIMDRYMEHSFQEYLKDQAYPRLSGHVESAIAEFIRHAWFAGFAKGTEQANQEKQLEIYLTNKCQEDCNCT